MDATRKSGLLAGIALLGALLLRLPDPAGRRDPVHVTSTQEGPVESPSLLEVLPDPGVHLTLVVDCSESMEGNARLERVRVAVVQLATVLGPQDTLGIVNFADQARVMRETYPVSGPLVLPPGFCNGGRPGGTNLFAGLEEGLALAGRAASGSHQVLIVSDGDANVGPVDSGSFQYLIERAGALGIDIVQFDLGGGSNPSPLEAYLKAVGKHQELTDPTSLGSALQQAYFRVKGQARVGSGSVVVSRVLGSAGGPPVVGTLKTLEVADGSFAD